MKSALVSRGAIVLALVVSMMSLSLKGWAIGLGEKAPDFQLTRANDGAIVSLGDLLAQKSVAIWFFRLEPECHRSLQTLRETASQFQFQLVAIPVAPDPAELEKAHKLFPDVVFLSDADGAVTLKYSGEFVPGVAPRENLYLVDTVGKLRAIRCYPGIPLRSLQTLFSQVH